MTLSLPFATTLSDDIVAPASVEYRDLPPMITRQRLVVECTEQYFRTTQTMAKEF